MKDLLKSISISNWIFLFIALFHFSITLFTDHIIFNKTTSFINPTYITVKIIVFIVLILFWQSVPYFINKIKEKDKKTIDFLKYFSIYFGIMLIFLALTWPGVWRGDEFYIFYFAKSLNFFYWHHWLTSIFYIFSLSILPFPAGIIIIQTFMISLIVAYIISNFQYLFPSCCAWILLVPFFFPSFIDNNLYPLRLPICSYLEIFLFCSIIFKYINKTNIEIKNILLWGILTSILSTWRTENTFFIAVIPIILIVIFYERLKTKHIISLFLTILILSIPIINIQNKGIGNNTYLLSGIVAPLTAIIKTDFRSNNKQKDLEIINNVINVNALKNNMIAVNVLFNEKNLNNLNNKKNMSELIKVYIKLIIYNYPEFIKERTKEFISSNFNIANNNGDAFTTKDYKPLEFSNEPINMALRFNVIKCLECRTQYNYYSTTYLFNFFYNPVISFYIMLTIFILTIYKRSRLWFIPFIILAQTVLTIFTMPTPLFMYYLPIYISSYVFAVMILLYVFSCSLNKTK